LIPLIVWRNRVRVKASPLEQLLDEFAHLRQENLIALQALNLGQKDLTRRGKHPELEW